MNVVRGASGRNRFMGGTGLLVLGLLLGSLGCEGELTGPDPSISGTPGAENAADRTFQPPFTCNEQLDDNWVELRGNNFTPVVADSLENEKVDTPHVTLERSSELDVRDSGDKSSFTFEDDVDGKKRLRWISKQKIELLIDEQLGLKPGVYDVTVENPTDDSTATKDEAFAVVPRPVVDSIEPTPKCDGDATVSVTVSGGPFLTSPDGDLPEVQVGGVEAEAESATSCESFDQQPLSGWSRCDEIEADISLSDYEPGLHAVRVDNPSPNPDRDVGCVSRPDQDEVEFRVVERPSVDNVAPSPICTEQSSYQVSLEGSGFVVDTRGDSTGYPSVTFGGTDVAVTAPSDPSSTDTCSETGDIPGVFRCSELEVEVAEDALHEDGTVTSDEVVVDNPPTGEMCRNEDPRPAIRNAPPPEVADASIQEACGSGPDKMAVEGSFHFEVGSNVPEVEITDPDGNSVTYSSVSLSGNCSGELDDTSQTARHCDVTRFDLQNATSVRQGDYDITFQNPETVQCSRQQTVSITPTQPDRPTISNIQEGAICAQGDTLTIEGTNFNNNTTVAIDGTEADMVNVRDGGTTIEATWNGEIGAGNNPTLTVSNGAGCEASQALQGAVEIVDGPIAIYLDPPIHYNQIDLRSTLYLTGGTSRSISKVQIRQNPNDTTRDLNFQNGPSGQVNPLLPDEYPQGSGNPLPPTNQSQDDYDVRVTEDVGGTQCGTWIQDLLEVTDSNNLAVDTISPKYGAENTTTSVRITAQSGASNQFQSTPRVYLSDPSGGSGTAAKLSGVTFNSPTEITGVVPDTLNSGDYNVIVVNPDGEVGVLSGSDNFTVTPQSSPPPTIDSVSPAYWETSTSNLSVTISGSNFRATSSNQGSVSVDCQKANSSPSSVSITMSSNNSLSLSVDTNGLKEDDICALTVTNPNDSNDVFSPVGTVNRSSNFIDFKNDASWTTSGGNADARRWPSMFSGVPTAQQQFVYAVGGDDGSTSSVKSDGRFASLDRFGQLGSWNSLRNSLKTGRSLARAVRIRDFVYVVGGNDGSGATTSIERAYVLEPSHTPTISGLDFSFKDPSDPGVSAGDYYYFVSAVHTTSSPHNPGGETLVSDVQPVSIPDLGNRFSVQVQLSWSSSLSDIQEYRVYRTQNPGDPIGTEQLYATIPAGTTSFTDDGSGSFTSDTPVPIGNVGKWHTITNSSISMPYTLNRARQKHAVRGLVSPYNANNSTNKAYIYAFGGEDPSKNPDAERESVERITIENPGSLSQSVTGVTVLSETLSSARTEVEGLLATSANADNLGTMDAYLYASGGATATGPGSNGADTVDSWQIQSGGTLGSGDTEAGMLKSRGGHVGTIANGYAVLFGGQNQSLDDTGDNSTPITSDGSIGGWNSLGGIDMQQRYQAGRVSLSGFFYVGGGSDGGGGAKNSVEYAVVGTTAR